MEGDGSERSDRRRADWPTASRSAGDVPDVFGVIRGCLKPGEVFSYFEHVGMRRTSQALAQEKRRAQIRSVSAYLADHISNHRFQLKTVLQNFPPARARHRRFS